MGYIRLSQAIGKSGKNEIKTIYDVFNLAIQMKRENYYLMEVTKTLHGLLNKNKNEDITNIEYLKTDTKVIRDYLNDRRFPLETVKLKSQELSDNEEINKAMIHTGPYADEFARSLHALAFTVGSDIFFRNGAYKPETEEGRALLAHELKHVSQYEENPSEDNRTKEELENEAISAEEKERYNPDPIVQIKIENKEYNLKQSKIAKLEHMAEVELEEWVEQQSSTMTESKYLEFLLKYKEYLEQGI